MEDIKVAKHQLEVCFRSNFGFKEEAPRVLRVIKQSSESYIQFFFKTLTEVLTSPQVHATPSTKFYALLTLLKASEAKNYSFYHFLVKESDLLNYIYHCAEYDLNPKSVSQNKGTHYFSKHPSPTDMILGFNVVRLCQEIIVDWNHLCKEFKPRKYFEIFKFLLGRVRKTNQLEKPFFFINKFFDLRKDLALCNFQTERPYIIPRSSGRNVLKVPNPAAQGTKNDEEPQVDSEDSVDMSMEDEFAEDADELMFTSANSLSHSRKSSIDNRRGSVLDQLRRESLRNADDNPDIQKLRSSQDFEKPEQVEPIEVAGGDEGDVEVEVITDELETEQVETVEQVEQAPETVAPQTMRVDISSAQNSPSKSPEGYIRYDSGDATVALSQQEENIEEQKGEDIEQEKKINVQKQLLVRTQPATPDKSSNFNFLGRGFSGGNKVFGVGNITSRNTGLESDLLRIQDSITKSQTMSRKSSLSGSQASTPQKKGSMFDFDPIKSQAELDTMSQDNLDVLVKSQGDIGKHYAKHKRVHSLQQGTVPQPAIFINNNITSKAELHRASERRASWHVDTSPGLEASREAGLVTQVSNMLVHSKGGLTQSIQRGIRAPQIGGKTNKIIVFADQEEKESKDNSAAQAALVENELLKQKLKEMEQMIKMLGGKVENLTMENQQLKKGA